LDRFRTISYLKSGNEIQRRAYEALTELKLFRDLAEYTPVLCGTVPIAIDVAGSDLDIILKAHDFARYMDEIKRRYGNLEGFRIKERTVKGVPTVIANFRFRSFDFELFAQPVPVEEQDAYRHMLIEHYVLETHPHMRPEIIRLKEAGWKTEPAFARVLGLTGDPYDELLAYGVRMGIVPSAGGVGEKPR
jgi:hypothetical protein